MKRIFAAQLSKLELFKIDTLIGGRQKAHKIHATDGGIFDQIYQP